MKLANILKKIRAFIRYHRGPKEFVSSDKLNEYIPDIAFEKNLMFYIIVFNPENNLYTMTVQPYDQGFDV